MELFTHLQDLGGRTPINYECCGGCFASSPRSSDNFAFCLTLIINFNPHGSTFYIFVAATRSTQGYDLNTYLGPYECA